GILGKASTYQTDLSLVSGKYTQFDRAKPSYQLAYKYRDPATGQWVTVKETAKTQLGAGWNLLTRSVTIGGVASTRTLLVYGDNTGPSFVIDPKVPTTINQADWNNGATWVL